MKKFFLILLIGFASLITACGAGKTLEPAATPSTAPAASTPNPTPTGPGHPAPQPATAAPGLPAGYPPPVTATLPPPKPTLTPAPVVTLTPVPSPTGWVESRPDCKYQGALIWCTDAVLGLEFKYPSSWGGQILSALLHPGGCGGYVYSYSFIIASSAPRTGGLSYDYCNPMGSDITSFSGWQLPPGNGSKAGDGCSFFRNALKCEYIHDNVLVAFLLPGSAESVCSPSMSGIYLPLAVIAIDLPQGPKVNGFIFIKSFLSTKASDRLFEPLGGTSLDYGQCSSGNPASQQKFDQRLQELSQALQSGRLDEETAYNIQQIKDFAKSIQSWKP